MKRLKQTISLLLMLSFICMYAAASTPEPQEIIKDETDGKMTVQKVYVLPKTESGESIPTEGYTEDGIEYVFTELVTKDNSQTDTKEHTETVSVHTDTNNTSAVISQFKPSLEISTEDGYTGTLELDYTTLDVKATDSVLSKGVGHFKDTSIWNGNVCIAGHNRGANSYFGEIHELDCGDTIRLTTRKGTRTYEVFSVRKISVNDTSSLQGTYENMITLITCVKNQSDYYRWCVQAREI